MPNLKPRRILLATDLSHRSDRALDRSVQLAHQWGATLVIVHAIEEKLDEYHHIYGWDDLPSWRRSTDPCNTVRNRLRRDLADEGFGLDVNVIVQRGTPSQIVLEAAQAQHADLIVAGVSGSQLLERMWLGSTVDRLIRKSPVPLLVVRDRAFAPYPRVVVATDFAPPSRASLETAATWFADANMVLFHAYDVPFASYLSREEINRQFDALGIDAANKFLTEADLQGIASSSIDRLIEHGSPEVLLRDYGEKSTRHLVVVGSHGGGIIYETLIGSTARKIIDSVPGDVLLVPDRSRIEARDAAG
ncbi:universal stress protein [Sphingomonas sp. ABOLG]|uniref:universal stress protein n=1 Tax=Sphingomonas sp. ABOLG TaxID=1985880 RepID=UPI000F7DB498|nr:universal stress protein [Sphingomonas sp. ABOLG]RSV14783.1 universal stress protein [Sphingomonas sp. ABOLG]